MTDDNQTPGPIAAEAQTATPATAQATTNAPAPEAATGVPSPLPAEADAATGYIDPKTHAKGYPDDPKMHDRIKEKFDEAKGELKIIAGNIANAKAVCDIGKHNGGTKDEDLERFNKAVQDYSNRINSLLDEKDGKITNLHPNKYTMGLTMNSPNHFFLGDNKEIEVNLSDGGKMVQYNFAKKNGQTFSGIVYSPRVDSDGLPVKLAGEVVYDLIRVKNGQIQEIMLSDLGVGETRLGLYLNAIKNPRQYPSIIDAHPDMKDHTINIRDPGNHAGLTETPTLKVPIEHEGKKATLHVRNGQVQDVTSEHGFNGTIHVPSPIANDKNSRSACIDSMRINNVNGVQSINVDYNTPHVIDPNVPGNGAHANSYVNIDTIRTNRANDGPVVTNDVRRPTPIPIAPTHQAPTRGVSNGQEQAYAPTVAPSRTTPAPAAPAATTPPAAGTNRSPFEVAQTGNSTPSTSAPGSPKVETPPATPRPAGVVSPRAFGTNVSNTTPFRADTRRNSVTPSGQDPNVPTR